jgi:RNA recognition motif-containing protein
MNIYVGNISRTANEQDLKGAFAAFGEVPSASIVKDKFSGESRGFGFVEMPNKEEADKAGDFFPYSRAGRPDNGPLGFELLTPVRGREYNTLCPKGGTQIPMRRS